MSNYECKKFAKDIWKKYRSKGKLILMEVQKFLKDIYHQKIDMENKSFKKKTTFILCGGKGTRLEL